MHKKKKRAERVSSEKVLESVSTEDTENASEELSERSEDGDDDRDEEPESSPTKVILKEADLVRYTKPFVIYITPLTGEEIEKYTKGMRVIHTSSSSDSEFEKMVSVWILFLIFIIFQVEKSKSSSRKSPGKKMIKPKEPSSDSEDSDVKVVSKVGPKFEFYFMVFMIIFQVKKRGRPKLSGQKSPRKKVIIPKESSSDSEDSDEENVSIL